MLTGMWYVEFLGTSEGRIAGEGCALFKTDDGGATWADQTQNMPEWAGTRTANVVATKPGTLLADEAVIISGHYDSVTLDDPMTLAPGADDDASGTAAVLEAARVMAGKHYQRTVRFICFGGEEQGTQGSAVYAANAANAGDLITGVLDFDMIGYVDQKPEFAEILCNGPSTWLADFVDECGAAYVPGFGVTSVLSSSSVRSDHGPFWLVGYPAITGYSDLPPVNPYYHTDGDTLGIITKSFLANCTRVAVATLAELAVPDTTTAGVAGGNGGGGDGRVANAGPVSAVAATPNPFSAGTVVAFSLGSRGNVTATVLDAEGRRVRTLVDGPLAAGAHQLAWDGRDSNGGVVSPGVYFVRVMADGQGERSAKIVSLR